MKHLTKRKLLSFVLALALFVSAIPGTVLMSSAEDADLEDYLTQNAVEINQTGYFTQNSIDIYTVGGDYITMSKAELPETFNVEYKLTDTSGMITSDNAEWYWLDTETWEGFDSAYYLVSTDCVSFVTEVSIEGLPDGVTSSVTEISDGKLSAVKESIIDFSVFKNYHDVNVVARDISPVDAKGEKWQPVADESVMVYISGIWDTSWDFPVVNVYHILESEDAIKALDASKVKTTTDAAVVAAYPTAAAAAEAAGYAAGTVAYEIFSTADGTVTLYDDGGISFEASSFSDYYITSGNGSIGGIQSGEHTIYITPGATGTFTINNDSVTLTSILPENVTVASKSNRNSTTFTVTAGSDAEIGSTGTMTLSWTGKNGRNSVAKITIVVLDEEAYEEEKRKEEFLNNEISHIQLNIDTIAVMIDGEEVDTLTDVNLGFSNSVEDGVLTKVPDLDSEVGYYYQYVYTGTYTDTNGVSRTATTTITIRIDETKTYPIDTSDLDFTITGVELVDDNQISFDGTFPVGTMGDDQVDYIITVETTYYGKNTTFNGKMVTFSDTIGFWDEDNVCPGVEMDKDNWTNGGIPSSGGIDVAKFSTGKKISDTTYAYVVYSGLTKVVQGYTFSENNSRNYAFTISYSADNGETWAAVDTISLTVGNSGSAKTALATEAAKYYDYISKGYKFKIEETGYNISGYDCTSSFVINGVTVGSNNVAEFDWKQTTTDVSITTNSDGTTTITKMVTVVVNGTETKTVTTITGSAGSVTTSPTQSSTSGNTTTTVKTEMYDLTGDTGKAATVTTVTTTKVTTEHNSTTTTTSVTQTITDADGEEVATIVDGVTTKIVYSAEISCTNTYEKLNSGLNIEKDVELIGNTTSIPSDSFDFVVTPKTLELEGDTDTSSYKVFNDGNYAYVIYDSNGKEASKGTATPVGGTNASYGTLTVSIKAGQIVNISNLPVGTYTVHEVSGTVEGVTYDTSVKTVTLKTDSAELVTFKNQYKNEQVYSSLSITKEVGDGKVYDEDDTFIFDVYEGDSTTPVVTVVLKAGGTVTISGLTVGSSYTVKERAHWRYNNGAALADQSITLVADAESNKVTFNNELTNEKWLTDTDAAKNVFSNNTVTDAYAPAAAE